MTDKQIIIDGFNLEYIKELLYNGQRSAITTNIFEAIIEELERKEQECEKAKQNAQDTYDLWQALIESFNILQGEKIKLEQEHKETQKALAKCWIENGRLKKECEELKEQLEIAKQNYSYEAEMREIYIQTLAEIKEICNKTVCDYLQCSLNYNHSKDFECEKTSCNRAKRRKFILEILQKINECEVDNG